MQDIPWLLRVKKLSYDLIPSGILHAHVQCLIGNGVVVSPTALFEEMKK